MNILVNHIYLLNDFKLHFPCHLFIYSNEVRFWRQKFSHNYVPPENIGSRGTLRKTECLIIPSMYVYSSLILWFTNFYTFQVYYQ